MAETKRYFQLWLKLKDTASIPSQIWELFPNAEEWQTLEVFEVSTKLEGDNNKA